MDCYTLEVTQTFLVIVGGLPTNIRQEYGQGIVGKRKH